jgi:aquaporin Z
MNKYLAECIGTFLLVFIGTLSMTQSDGSTIITALGFGITLFVVLVFSRSVSLAHVNPAVSLGAWIRGSLSTHDIVPYWIAQGVGAVLGSLLVWFIVGQNQPIGETTFGMADGAALLIEAVLTFIFVSIVLFLEKRRGMSTAFVIAAAFFAMHFVGIPLTGASLNPIRSIAPVVVSIDPVAAQQLWVYTVGPFLGGVSAGFVFRIKRMR